MAVFTAILRSYQLLNDQVHQVMRSHDLTFARYEVLTWLATDPESSLTLSWISKTLRIPPATVTDIIDRLEDEKLVRRVPHPSDARTTLAVINPRGRKAAMDATRDLNSTVYERIGLSERQRGQLTDLLADTLAKSGNEFDVERSSEVIEEVGSRAAPDGRAQQSQEAIRGGLGERPRGQGSTPDDGPGTPPPVSGRWPRSPSGSPAHDRGPVGDESFVGRHAPEDVEQGGGHSGPPPPITPSVPRAPKSAVAGEDWRR